MRIIIFPAKKMNVDTDNLASDKKIGQKPML